MTRWTATTLLCLSAITAAQAQGPTAGTAPVTAHSGAALTTSCTDPDCRPQIAASASGAVLPTSDRARAIARKLDGTGYYSRYSRALRGYPHLRSRRDEPRTAAATPGLGPSVGAGAGVANSQNRRRFRATLQEIALRHRVDYKLLDAVIIVESAYDPYAVSPKGAMGLMQLMPDTAKRFQVADPFDPAANIDGGARYLRWLMQHFDGNLQLVLAAYNAGENAVARNGNQIPPYEETRAYVQRVLNLYQP